MPRPRKPTALKVIAGTSRPDRAYTPEIELPLVESLPNAPDWMPNTHAVKEWDRLARILIANKLLAEADLTALGHMCALHGKIVQLYAAGESPTASMAGALRVMQGDFGLSPVARGKVSAGSSDKPSGNKFATIGRRPGA